MIGKLSLLLVVSSNLSLEFRIKEKPVIFMTLLLLILVMALPRLADGGNETGANDGSCYTFLITKYVCSSNTQYSVVYLYYL